MFEEIPNKQFMSLDIWLESSIILVAGIMITLLFRYINPIIIEYASNKFNVEKEPVIQLIHIPSIISIFLVTVHLSVKYSPVVEYIYSWTKPVVLSLLVVVWMRSIMKFGNNIIDKTLDTRNVTDITPIAKNIWTFLTIIIFIFLILNSWDVNITPFLASAGVAGIVIGLAARETVENFFGGIALYADRTYQRGDFIEVDTDVSGWVRNISIRSTVVHTLDGDSITIPNSKLHKSIIKNKTYPKNVFRISIGIGVSYESDPQKVQDILKDTILKMSEQEDSLVLDNPQPKVYLDEFGDSAIKFNILTWISLPNQKLIVRDRVNNKVYEELNSEGIEIPYPQRTIHMKNNESDGSE